MASSASFCLGHPFQPVPFREMGYLGSSDAHSQKCSYRAWLFTICSSMRVTLLSCLGRACLMLCVTWVLPPPGV